MQVLGYVVQHILDTQIQIRSAKLQEWLPEVDIGIPIAVQSIRLGQIAQ